MLINKWIQFGMSFIIVATGAMAAVDWTTIFSQKTAATIASIVGVLKMITNALAPAKTDAPAPTGGRFITHN